MLIITKQPYETVTNETNIMIKYFIFIQNRMGTLYKKTSPEV